MVRPVWFCLAGILAGLLARGGSHVTDEGLATSVERPVSIRTLGNGHTLLDFGRNAAGYVQFDAREPSDYRFVIGELLNADGSGVARDAGEKWGCSFTWVKGPDGKDYRTSVRFIDVAARVETAGTCRVPFKFKWQKRFDTAASVKAHPKAVGDVMTFRYLEIVVPPKGVSPSDIRRAIVHADFDWNDSSFVSSDATLNAVYDLCKWTVHADSYLGFWVDGDRERKLYEADQYVIQNVAAALFADNRVTRRSVRALLRDRYARNGIFEWQQFIPLLAFADWFNTGDAALVSDPLAWREIISCLRTDREAADGVLTARAKDFASIVDHPPENLYGYDGGALNDLKRVASDGRRLPVENALHYASLKALAQMASARGEAKDAATYEARAAKTYRGFNDVFFDAKAGLYRDRAMTNGYISAHHSTLANAYALAFGLVPAQRQDFVANFVATNRVTDGLPTSPYASFFVLDGLCRAGRTDAAIAHMTSTNRNGWVNMMREGLTTAGETWSLFSSVVPGNYYDLSHAWGTAPAYVVSRYVLGVRPASPGFRTAVVAPSFGPLAWAKGIVPTPLGGVAVLYTNRTLTVSLPAAMTSATVVFANRTREAKGGETVTIAEAPEVADGGLPPGCAREVLPERYWRVWSAKAQGEIDAAIERNRKANGAFRLPVAVGTQVRVEQLSHEFRFGAFGNKIGSFATEEENVRFETLFTNLFNQITIPFYWRTFEPLPGRTRMHVRDTRPRAKNWLTADEYIAFAKSHGLRIHGHPLCWGSEEYMMPFWLYDEYCPPEEKRFLRLPTKDPHDNRHSHCGVAWRKAYRDRIHELFFTYGDDEIAAEIPQYLANMTRLYQSRITEILKPCADRVDSWDVVNESSEDWSRTGRNCESGKPLTRSVYGILPPDYALEAFRTAAKEIPKNAKMAINDWNIGGSDYPGQIRDLVAHGARIDLVGAQFHLFQNREFERVANGGDYRGLATPGGIRKTFAELSVGGRPVHLSEITIPAAGGGADAEQRQAVVAWNLYRAWFSQPSAWGITWWHALDWWKAGDTSRPHGGVENGSAGYLDAQLAPKPVYRALDELINRVWRMRLKATAETDASGKGVVRFRGFRGTYRLAWTCPFCGHEHDRLVSLSGDGVVETKDPLRPVGCRRAVRKFKIDGRTVELSHGEDYLDLAKIYPDAVRKGADGTRWAEVSFVLSVPESGTYRFPHFNDWFGEIRVNDAAPIALNGPSDVLTRIELPLRKGDNVIRYRTRAGSGGVWKFAFFEEGYNQ